MPFTLIKSKEYNDWFSKETEKNQYQINRRLSAIEYEDHFGNFKDLKDSILELKWGNGRRVYFSFIPESKVLILLGGNKNGQSKDISKAKTILNKWKEKNKYL